MLSLQAASIFSTTVEAILYGYSVFMFMLAMWFMLRNRRRRYVNPYMVGAGCALIVLATVEMGVNIARVFEGFISKGPFMPGGSEAYFASVSEPTFVAKSCLYNTQTLILDAVVIYRTYVVWQSRLVVIVPMIGWCGLLAGSIGLNFALATASSHQGDVFAAQTGQWITSVYSLTLATNLSSTTLLAFKIWTVTRRSAQFRSTNILSPVLRVIIESGAIYSMTITAALISFVVKSNGVYVVLDMISPIISIVFNMLIIRVGLANERSYLSTGTSASMWGAAMSERCNGGMRRRPDGTYEMRDLKVEITQVIEDDSQYGREDAVGSGTLASLSPIELKGEPLGIGEAESPTESGSYSGSGKAVDRSSV